MMMRLLAMLMVAAPAWAAELPLVIYYNDRPPQHFTEHGAPRGPAIDKVTAALKAANLDYEIRNMPAKEQLVILQANHERACMLAWVNLPGRDDKGKFSAVIYRDEPKGSERRLWCTKVVPEPWMQRLNQALLK
jgi:hypothetical protein